MLPEGHNEIQTVGTARHLRAIRPVASDLIQGRQRRSSQFNTPAYMGNVKWWAEAYASRDWDQPLEPFVEAADLATGAALENGQSLITEASRSFEMRSPDANAGGAQRNMRSVSSRARRKATAACGRCCHTSRLIRLVHDTWLMPTLQNSGLAARGLPRRWSPAVVLRPRALDEACQI